MVGRVRTVTRQAQELRVEADRLAAHLDASREEAARWRLEASDLIAGLSAAIDRQLERWELTPAEKAVALLLLKGLSHKEVAGVRGERDDRPPAGARDLPQGRPLGASRPRGVLSRGSTGPARVSRSDRSACWHRVSRDPSRARAVAADP
jgi:hypothetical protein